MSTLTITGNFDLSPGETVSMKSNRYRYRVERVEGRTAHLAEFVRPSRGYARHIRKIKNLLITKK